MILHLILHLKADPKEGICSKVFDTGGNPGLFNCLGLFGSDGTNNCALAKISQLQVVISLQGSLHLI